MIDQRSRVPEYRINTTVFHFSVRWWLEADKEKIIRCHSMREAKNKCRIASEQVVKAYSDKLDALDEDSVIEAITRLLLEKVKEANSVEVMTNTNEGMCIHRDWP